MVTFANPAPGAPERLDGVAARRTLKRLDRAEPAPWLHQEVARRMGERLAVIRHKPLAVLDWSGRAGASRPVLAEVYPQARLTRIEDGAGEAVAAEPWWQRWWPGVPVESVLAPGAVERSSGDLVWSNMRLHFEPDPLLLMRTWRMALAPDGFLMFSTLGPGSLGGLRESYAAAGWGAHGAPFVDMHDLGDMLVEAGFADPVMDQETITLTYSSPQALLCELRGLGANLAPRRFEGLRTARWRAALERALAGRAGAHGRLGLEFELVYGHAFRAPDTGPRVDALTQIGLNEMKLMLRKPGRRK
jgi:malonyl-CoA O-methyltransferase